MMRQVSICMVIFWLLVGVPSVSPQDTPPPVVVADTEVIDLSSETNGHDYRLFIALPGSYTASEQSYPVLYLLDPQISFLAVTEYARFMAYWQELPEIIVVGIGYPTLDVAELATLRERDYYISKDEFLGFVSEEVFPLVDSTYRTISDDRAIVGFSYGGELVFHVLVTQPELFNRYVAIDASSAEMMPYVMRDDASLREGFAGRDVRLFMATTGTEMIAPALETRAYEGLRVEGLSLGSITHAAALHFSLPAAISAIYAP